MIEVLFEILPYAVGIAISPVPIITVILSLFSIKAKWNGPSFLFGWILGILVVCMPILMFAERFDAGSNSDPDRVTSIIRVLLGLLLFAAAIRRWLGRPKKPEDIKMPKWLMMIEAIAPWKVFVIGFLFAVVTNPKNFALTVAATLPIANAAFSMPEKTILTTLFILISSAGVGVPVILYLVSGESARKVLNSWKSWLVVNNSAVMATLFLVFGAVLCSEGIRGLY